MMPPVPLEKEEERKNKHHVDTLLRGEKKS
jgi:hypothetical protein